jgi:hypothetical protein
MRGAILFLCLIAPAAHAADVPPLTPGSPLWIYAHTLGAIDGDRSAAAPVNSLYARQAFDRHGPWLGTLLAIDRLLRDAREMARPLARVADDGRVRYLDPLSRNDFWLRGER